jgi:hypothetical protein
LRCGERGQNPEKWDQQQGSHESYHHIPLRSDFSLIDNQEILWYRFSMISFCSPSLSSAARWTMHKPPRRLNGPSTQRLDPAFDQIIASDARMEVLGQHFGPTEGPV